jgi:hypothetical protein
MTTCVACNVAESAAGHLCEECAASIHGPMQALPQQVRSNVEGRTYAVLVDCWGQAHALGSRTLIGREVEPPSVLIAQGSISRKHAEIVRKPDGSFWLIDLVSSNGTTYDDKPVTGPVQITSHGAIFFGDVGMYFVTPPPTSPPKPIRMRPTDPPPKRGALASIPRLYEPDPDAEEPATFMGLPAVDLHLASPSGGGGGVIAVDRHTAQLTVIQYALLHVLVERVRAEENLDERVRGFVRSTELLATLPWDTPRPDDNHIKQLVRRVRRTLVRANIGDLIESRQGFGYRLRVRLLPR